MLFSTVLCLSAIAGAFALPAPGADATSTLPKCVRNKLRFNIKVQSLLDTSGNILPSAANGQFLVNVGGPVGFSATNSTAYTLTKGLLAEVGSQNVAAVKSTIPNPPHQGDIMLVPTTVSLPQDWPLLACTNNGTALACTAGNRNVLQVCGKFVNMDPTPNSNCQDQIQFDVIPLCQLS